MATLKAIHNLNVQEQFAIAKRLGSHLILPFVDMMIKGSKTKVTLIPALIMALNKMSDDDANFIMETCLKKVYDVASSPPAPAYSHGQIMFDDLSLTELLNFTAEIIMRDMVDFLNTVLPSLTQEQTEE